MSSTSDTTAPPVERPAPHTPWGRVVGLGVAVAAVVGVLVLAFSWPAVTAEPKDLPVAVAGPPQAVAGVGAALVEAQPGAVDLLPVADRDAAVAAIQERDAYGAIVLGEAPEVLTASAAGSVTNQLLTGLAPRLQAGLAQQAAAAGGDPAAAPSVTVTDVVPLSPDDPRGTGLTAAMFPLLLGGMLGGIAISVLVVGALRRVLAVAVYAAVGGGVLVAVLQSWFGVLQGDWWTNAGAAALALAAVAAPITGFVALLGRAGIAVGTVTMMLVANPISGATMPPEFLPWHWGEIGQWFPPGAGATLLRDLSYFPSADAAPAWLALGLWAAAGVLLSLVGHLRTAGGVEPDAEAARDEALERAARHGEPALHA
ncbi:hypothetical protein [Isoptericola sp. NPDC056134]|uniref:hypothetical protein n=1 Tax=Isoptericola sp. NPDC056134 TaxID=3345723 RepID=UPI0035EA2D02